MFWFRQLSGGNSRRPLRSSASRTTPPLALPVVLVLVAGDGAVIPPPPQAAVAPSAVDSRTNAHTRAGVIVFVPAISEPARIGPPLAVTTRLRHATSGVAIPGVAAASNAAAYRRVCLIQWR